jgi:hypothetical protein
MVFRDQSITIPQKRVRTGNSFVLNCTAQISPFRYFLSFKPNRKEEKKLLSVLIASIVWCISEHHISKVKTQF